MCTTPNAYNFILSFACGVPARSKDPPVLNRFQRRRPYGCDRVGGGVVIPCRYVINVKDEKIARRLKKKLVDLFRDTKGKETVTMN